MTLLEYEKLKNVRKLHCNICHTNVWPSVSACQTRGRDPSCSFGWKDTKWCCGIFPLPVLLLTTHIDFYMACKTVRNLCFSPSPSSIRQIFCAEIFTAFWTDNHFFLWQLRAIEERVKAFNFLFQNEYELRHLQLLPFRDSCKGYFVKMFEYYFLKEERC